MQLEIFTYKPKSMFFYQLTVLSNNHVLMSCLSGIYFKSWFYWQEGWVQKTLIKRTKQTEYKH